jgi:polysaccharide pyruvyl transferase WcaK-like protein
MSGSSQHERPAIAVWGHVTGGNLGDELVLDVVIGAIRRRMPDCRLVAISSAPWDTEERHAVSAYPLNPVAARRRPVGTSSGVAQPRTRLRRYARRVPGARAAWATLSALRHTAREVPFALRSYRQLRAIDRIVVAGSGQLLDKWQGPWWHPYTTFRWALLARLARTEMLYPSVGAGPIDYTLSRFMFRKSLEWASFVSVRDRHSADVLRTIGLERTVSVCPDMGWAFELATAVTRGPRRPDESAIVGVNPMSHEDPRYWPRGDADRYEAYVSKLARFVAHLLRQGDDVLLFSSQSRADANVAADLRRLLVERGLDDHPSLESAIDQTTGVDDLVRAVSRCDYVIAGRFHSVLLPTALGIPTIGLAYHEKTCELLRDVGRPRRCLDIDRFQVPELLAAFAELRAEDGKAERTALRVAAERLDAAVEEQFDRLFGACQLRPAEP